MSLVEGDQLLQRFSERLVEATQVDIAVAWATSCGALEALHKRVSEGTAMRIAVGVSGNVTVPTTLRRLQKSKSANLRIAPSPQHGIFHPKYFCFHGPDRTICWVGSANLTRRGFGGNNELVHEFDDSAGEGRHWFEFLWNTLDPEPGPAIDDYEKRWKPRKCDPRPPPSGGTPELVPLSNQSTWDDFVGGLRARDNYCRSQRLIDWKGNRWDIFGLDHSYLHTIFTGREVARLQDWGDLTKRECNILLGRDDHEGAWGLLGSLIGAGKVAHVFKRENMPDVGLVRKEIHHQVRQVVNATNNEIARVAHRAVQEIRSIDGFGAAAATRLLTLVRPDCLVSVNKESAARLGALSGQPPTRETLANNYVELLNWMYDQPWFNARQPADPSEQEIWNCRAALLDAFAYEKING